MYELTLRFHFESMNMSIPSRALFSRFLTGWLVDDRELSRMPMTWFLYLRPSRARADARLDAR